MQPNISAIILAGGKASRMNHVNKGLQLFRDKPLIQYVIERLQGQVDDIVISANADIDRYQKFGLQVASDIGTSKGPLSGVQAAAKLTRHDVILVTACDMPFLPTNIVLELQSGTEGVVVAESNSGIEPLVSLVNQAAIATIQNRIDEGKLSVLSWLNQNNATRKDLTRLDPEAFYNINSLDELFD